MKLTYIDYKIIFKSKYGFPISENKLTEYIEFCLDNITDTTDLYCEVHHILPKTAFPEFKSDQRNLARLIFKHHKQAHILLAEAYPLKEFTCVIRTMIETDDPFGRSLKSIRQMEWWQNMDEETRKAFCDNIGYHRKIEWNSLNDIEKLEVYEHMKRMNELANTPDKRLQKSETLKLRWKENTEWVTKRRNDMSILCNLPENKAKKAEQKQKWWDNLTQEEYESFCFNMSIVNKNTVKREKAGIKIKLLWQDEEYSQRVLESRKLAELRPEVKEKRSNSAKEMWKDPVKRANMLRDRKTRKRKRWWNNGIDNIKDFHPPSDEWIEGKLKPKLPPKEKSISVCPYCNKIGATSPMKRWHFENCKRKLNETDKD